jgi:hypothetical protein
MAPSRLAKKPIIAPSAVSLFRCWYFFMSLRLWHPALEAKVEFAIAQTMAVAIL